MKVNDISIGYFGKFEQSAILAELSPHINLIYGQNEAGKTTLFHLLVALLYGFSPANRRDYPYVHRAYEGVHFEASVVMNEKKYYIKRTLKSKPELEVYNGENSQKSGNRSLPFTDHVSRAIYENVYALDVASLNVLTDKTWSEIQEKLLFNLGTQCLANPSQIISEFEQKSGELWRDNRRGKQVVRQIDEQIRALKKERNQALKAYEQVYELEKQLKVIEKDRGSLKTKLQRTVAKIETAKKWLPVWSLLNEKRQLRQQCMDVSGLTIPLKENYLEMINTMEKEMLQDEKEMETLEQKRMLKHKEVRPLLLKEQQLLEHEHELQQLLQWAQSIENYQEQIDQLLLQIKQEENTLFYQGKQFFNLTEVGLVTEGFLKTDTSKLIGALRELVKIKSEKEPLKMDDILRAQTRSHHGVPIFGCCIALVLTAYGIFVQNPYFSIVGAVLSGALLMYLSLHLLKRKNGGKKLEEGLANQQKEKIEQILEKHQSLPFQEEVLREFDEDQLRRFEKLLENLENRGSLRTKLLHLQMQQETIKGQIGGLHILKGITSSTYNNLALSLSNRLETLRAQERDNALLAKEMEQLDYLKSKVQKKYEDLKEEHENITMQLLKVGYGNVERGAESISVHLKAQDRIQEVDAYLNTLELESMPAEKITANELERIEKEREILHNQESELRVSEVAFQKDLEQLKEQVQLNAIDNRIKILETERQELAVKRDHYMVMATLIREAEERYRLKHQPDVLIKASKYFEKMTKGRYTQLLMDLKEGTPKLQVIKQGTAMPIDFDARFSKGTQHQLFLALRLALIDHLDEEHAKLPIFFDESLINWDRERLEPTLELIQKIAEKRQVFFFTCHDYFAKSIEEQMSVKRIHLDGGTTCHAV